MDCKICQKNISEKIFVRAEISGQVNITFSGITSSVHNDGITFFLTQKDYKAIRDFLPPTPEEDADMEKEYYESHQVRNDSCCFAE